MYQRLLPSLTHDPSRGMTTRNSHDNWKVTFSEIYLQAGLPHQKEKESRKTSFFFAHLCTSHILYFSWKLCCFFKTVAYYFSPPLPLRDASCQYFFFWRKKLKRLSWLNEIFRQWQVRNGIMRIGGRNTQLYFPAWKMLLINVKIVYWIAGTL